MDKFFKPEGVYPAMLTPFDQDGGVNEKELRRYVNWLIDSGVDGLFPLGSVGEFIHCSFEEKVNIMRIVCEEANGRVPVLPGTAEASAFNSIKLTKKAQELGCSAAVIAPPYFFPASQEVIEEHYQQIIKELPNFSIILYNIPLFSDPISYDVVQRLSKHVNVVGMKDSSGSMVDLLHYMDKVNEQGEEVNFLVGREEMLLSSLMMGAKGTMSATAGIVPEIMVGIYRNFQEGCISEAKRLQFSMLKLVRAMFTLPFPVAFKSALEVRGFEMGPLKRPFSKADEEKASIVKKQIEEIMVQMLGDKVLVK